MSLTIREELLSDYGFNLSREICERALLKQLSPEELANMAESKSVIGLCDALIYLAIKERASDIHIEPAMENTKIRFRIDGRLQEFFTIASALHPALRSRIKILCNLNIAEARFPQDGRFSIPLGTQHVNFRVSVMPTIYGEKIVLRILALTGKKDFRTLDQMLISRNISALIPRMKSLCESFSTTIRRWILPSFTKAKVALIVGKPIILAGSPSTSLL